MFKLFFPFVLFSVAVADIIKFQDCGSKAKIESLDVAGCTAEPCPFIRKTNQTMKLMFTSNEDSKGAKTVLHGIIGGVPVPFPVPDDCCANHNLDCPVVNGKDSQYNLIVYISPSYPKIRLLVKLEVKDDNGQDLICAVLPAVISDPS